MTDFNIRYDFPGARMLLGAILISIAVFAVYGSSIKNGFIWDDESYVTENAALRSASGLRDIWLKPKSIPQYYPLVHTTFWIEFRFWSLNPVGFHLTNTLLHALNALLLWFALRRLGVPGAYLASLIFAVHPVHVESVAWITERKNLLSGFFYLASLLAWLKFCPPNETERGAGWGTWLVSLLLFACALLSKTVTATLPAVLVLLMWWKGTRITARHVAALAPMFLVGVGLALLTVHLEKHHVGAVGADWSLTFLQRALIAGRVLCFYMGKLAWPHPLIFTYPRWIISANTPEAYLYPLLIFAAVAAVWAARRLFGRGPLTGLLFFAGTLAPVLGFLNVYPMRFSFVADHFVYLASIGPIALAAAVLARVKPAPRSLIAWVMLAALGLTAHSHTKAFRDNETLWLDTLAKNPSSWMALNNLGIIRGRQGRHQEARALFREALPLRPDLGLIQYNLGANLLMHGRVEEAIPYLEDAVLKLPETPHAHLHLGLAYARLGKFDQATALYEATARLNPTRADSQFILGMAFHYLGESHQAIRQYSRAVELNPNHYDALNNLAWLLATHPRHQDAPRALSLAQKACELTHYRQPNLLDTLAAALAAAGQFAEAGRVAAQAVDLFTQSRQETAAAQSRHQLELYRRGEAYRDEPGPEQRSTVLQASVLKTAKDAGIEYQSVP